jgi:hypothetical protein
MGDRGANDRGGPFAHHSEIRARAASAHPLGGASDRMSVPAGSSLVRPWQAAEMVFAYVVRLPVDFVLMPEPR